MLCCTRACCVLLLSRCQVAGGWEATSSTAFPFSPSLYRTLKSTGLLSAQPQHSPCLTCSPASARLGRPRRCMQPHPHPHPHPSPRSLLWPQEFSLRGVWEYLPTVAFYAFGMSFLAVTLAIGIFKPRRQMPTDIFAVRAVLKLFLKRGRGLCV